MNLYYDAYSSAGIYHSDNTDTMVLDSHVFMEEQSSLSAQTAPDSGVPLFGVLDGMGVGETGKHASVLAAKALCPGLSTIYIHGDVTRQLCDLISSISDEIAALGPESMSTCTALVIIQDGIHLIHAGDSRMLIVHGGEILQYTPDHSLAGFYGLEPTQKTTQLFCALGSPHLKDHVIIEDIPEEVSAGDTIYLFMTDGLYPPASTTDDMLDSLELSWKTTAKSLIDRALKNNLKDTMSVIKSPIGT